MLSNLTKKIGFLRLLLVVGIFVLIGFAPFSGGEVHYSGWRIVPSLIVPSIVPMVLFVLPLDMTMCGVFMSGETDAARARYRFIIAMDVLLFAALLLAWLPFFLDLLRP